MKRVLLATVTIAPLMASAAHAQVVVSDPTGLIQQVKSVANGLKEVEQVAQQLQWAEQQYNSLVSNPTGELMSLLSQYGITDPLGISPQTMLTLINGHAGLSGLSGVINTLSTLSNAAYSLNHVYSPTDGSWQSQQIIANGNSIANGQGVIQQIFSQVSNRYTETQSLSTQLAAAATPADREHIMGQIQAQQVWAQQAGVQLQSAQAMLIAQQASAQQQDDEHLAQSLDNQIAQARAAGVIQ